MLLKKVAIPSLFTTCKTFSSQSVLYIFGQSKWSLLVSRFKILYKFQIERKQPKIIFFFFLSYGEQFSIFIESLQWCVWQYYITILSLKTYIINAFIKTILSFASNDATLGCVWTISGMASIILYYMLYSK